MLSAGERSLIRVRALYIGASAIMSIFLGLYLLHVGGVATVATFFAAYFSFLTLGFLVAAPLLRAGATGTVMRWGALFLCGVYLLLVLLGPSAVDHVVLMGALGGVGVGLFWAGHNLTEYAVTSEPTRSLYLGRMEAVSQLAATVAPPLAGAVLVMGSWMLPGHTRYYVLFGVLTAALMWVRHAAGRLPKVAGISFSLPDIWRGERADGWWDVLGQQFLRGIWESVTYTFAPILVFVVVRSELGVSVFAAGTTLLSAGVALLAGRMLHRWASAYVVGVVAVPVGLLVLAFGHSWAGIAAYVLCVTCGDHFARIGMVRGMYGVMESGAGAYYLFVHREIALNAGRVLSFVVVLLLTARLEQMQAVSVGIALVAAMPLLGGLLQWRIDRVLAAPAVGADTERLLPEPLPAAA